MNTSEVYAPPKEAEESSNFILTFTIGMLCCSIIGGAAGMTTMLILKHILQG